LANDARSPEVRAEADDRVNAIEKEENDLNTGG
jgi:hypothetical protein